MTVDEAENILTAWQDFMEMWDKFGRLMLPIPPSFYPYPPEILAEGLDIMEKRFADTGNNKMANLIQSTKVSLWNCPKNDEEALDEMRHRLNMMFEHPELKETLIEKLHEVRDAWAKIRQDILSAKKKSFWNRIKK